MKTIKFILCIFSLAAFLTACENESIKILEETVLEDTNMGLKQLEDLPPEKVRAFPGFNNNNNNNNNRVALSYEGQLCPGEVASGEVELGSIFNYLAEADFWYFTAEAGDLVTFEVNRTNCNADPYMEVYFGSMDTDNLLFLGVLDDEAEPDCTPDCPAFGDPYLIDAIAPFTGVYTIGVAEWGLADCVVGTGTYDIILTGQNACVINIDGCDSGVANQFVGDSNMDEILNILEADSYRNHGEFVRAVTQLTNEWKNAGLITGAEKGDIVACAAQSSIPL